MSVDRNLPCLIGTARRTWHPGGDPAPEPLDMWEELARAAAADAGVDRDVIAAVDNLGVVHCQSWAYDDPTARLVERLGIGPAHAEESILAGTSPQRLINFAAERMLRGEVSVALIVGAEALATRRLADRAGEPLGWSHPHPSPSPFPIDLDEWYLPTELAHGVLPAWLTFALLEQARWAEAGAPPGPRVELGEILERLSAVAAGNPDAWFREAWSGEGLLAPSPDNRMITTPYTKRSTAFMDVDMAAANLLVTHEIAESWGVPRDRRVYLRGWGFARDAVNLAARDELHASDAMRRATGGALALAGMGVDDVDVFDLYSCFGSAVEFARDALGLQRSDPRPISVTGGLPYHGGPSSNYMGHSISHLVDRLRAEPGAVGMTTGIGMHMTKHVAGVWSTTPGPLDLDRAEPVAVTLPTDRAVRADADGPARIVAATVIHAADGAPEAAVAICEFEDGSRSYARTDRSDVMDAIIADEWPDRPCVLASTPAGVNDLRI